jgi:hypothetical protein
MPAALNLADVAGKWTMQVMPENSDSVLLTYELTATADTTGWMIKFPDRPAPLPIASVMVAGDSVVTTVAPYPSVLQPGVQVSTDGVMRLQGGQLVGTTVAHYSVTTADSVRRLRQRGTRAP